MENPINRLNKDWEDKSAKKKPRGKKRWLLSRQYLQPLEEPDDVAEKELYSDLSVRDKLRCICRSAFYGMKEGLLTGVFLGGFYGVLKFLNGSSSAFFEDEENNENEKTTSKHYYGSGVPKERKNTSRSRRVDTRTYASLGRRQSGNRNSSISYEEKLSSYRTIEETLYGLNRDNKQRNLYAGKRSRNMDLNYSKLPVRTDKYSVSSSSRVGDKKKYIFGKTTEKVEIVGYAFVQTMGAFETDSTKAKNLEYGSPKQSKIEIEKKCKEEEEEAEEEEQEPYSRRNKSSVDSTQTFLSQRLPDSMKNSEKSKLPIRELSAKILKSKESGLNQKHEKSAKSLKSKESVLIAKHEKSKSLKNGESLLTPKHEKSNSSVGSGSASVIEDSFYPSAGGSEREPKESAPKGFHKAFSSLKSVTSKNKSKQSVISEAEERQKPSRITIVSPKYNFRDSYQGRSAEQSSSILIKSLEPDQSEISTRPTNEPSQDSRLRLKDSSKSTRRISKHSVRSTIIKESEVSAPENSQLASRTTEKSSENSKGAFAENVYPTFRAPSYLVNAEDVSNGYGSPITVASPEQQSEHSTIHSKFSESSFSPDIDSSRAELDDVGFTGSNISEFQMRVPINTFSPSISASQPDQNRTTKNSTWSFSVMNESNRLQTEESASTMTRLRDESNITLKTATQSRSVIFSDSGRSAAQMDRSNLSELPSVQHFEKSIFASEQISEKSHLVSKNSPEKREKAFISSEQVSEEPLVAGSFDKSFVSSEQVSGKSHVPSTYSSEKPFLSSEQVSEKSHLVSKYSSENSEKSFISSEQVSEESPVAGSFDKPLLSSAQAANKSHVAEEFPSEKSLLSSERLTERSRVSNQCSQNLNTRSQNSTKSCAGVIARSNSSLIQNVGPNCSTSSMAKGALAASRTQKESLNKEEAKEFGLFSSVSDNTIVLCACNCAIVIGIICTVISTTRASLKI